MTPFTQSDVDAHNARVARGKKKSDSAPSDDAVGAGEEGELHEEILKYLKREGIAYVHARMDVETTTNKGVPDFCIAAPGDAERHPRVLWAECKTKNGKLKPDQEIWKFLCERAGHQYHIVRSMREFMELMK